MKRFKLLFERIVELLLALSGSITTLTILLMVVFLFKEGFGLFHSPEVEKGYTLCLQANNPVNRLNPAQIKQIFDSEIENWEEVGGLDQEIVPFRFEEIFNSYSDEELGEDYALLPEKLGEVIANEPGIIAFIPTQYLPTELTGVKTLQDNKINIL